MKRVALTKISVRNVTDHTPRYFTAMSVQSAHKVPDKTPLGSLIEQPPTPPPSNHKFQASEEERIIEAITRRKTGRYDSEEDPWQRYNLSPAAFQRIEKHFQNDHFVQHKVRYDYFPSRKVFVLRRPTLIHQIILARVVFDIQSELRSISNEGGPASLFAKSVLCFGRTSQISEDPERSKHDPDVSFGHDQAYFQGVIIESSYSQKRKDLLPLAEDYIYGSDGNTRVVIGVDADYKEKSATLLMWQAQIQTDEAGGKVLVAQQTLNQKFRMENGEVNPDTELRIRLEDFAHPSFSEHTKFGKDISISSTALCAYLHEAEQALERQKQKLGFIPLPPGMKMRCDRPPTPPEELNTDDESHYQEGGRASY